MARLRGASVDFNSIEPRKETEGFINCTLPLTYVTGDPDISIEVRGGVLADGLFPDTFEVFTNSYIFTLDGGVVGIGPYSVSGHSYAAGVERLTWGGGTVSTWVASGLGQTGTRFNMGGTNTDGYVLEDGAVGGFAGEGGLLIAPGTWYGPIGWNPRLGTIFTQVPLTTELSPGQAVTFSLSCFAESTDAANPDRTIYPVITEIIITAGGVAQVLDLSTMQCGFNTGGIAVATSSEGPQTYGAYRLVSLGEPAASTDHSDFYLVAGTPAQASVRSRYGRAE